MSRLQSRPRASAQRGMAIIAALLVVMLATLLVTGLLQRQAADLRALENAMARSQAQLLLRSGLDWARLILYSDGRNYATTTPAQLWAVPVEDTRLTQADDGRVAVFSGRIFDEQGKINLRNLAQDGRPDEVWIEVFGRLLALLGEPAALAPVIARRIALAQAGGAEDGPPSAPVAPMPVSLDELLQLEMVSAQTVDLLRAHATILPERTAVNANTASAEVLAAVVPGLSLASARALVAQRDRGQWFNNQGDVENRIGDTGVKLSPNQIVANSNWFLVKGTVTLERAVVGTEALVRRGTAPLPEILWTREMP